MIEKYHIIFGLIQYFMDFISFQFFFKYCVNKVLAASHVCYSEITHIIQVFVALNITTKYCHSFMVSVMSLISILDAFFDHLLMSLLYLFI